MGNVCRVISHPKLLCPALCPAEKQKQIQCFGDNADGLEVDVEMMQQLACTIEHRTARVKSTKKGIV
jgi:hypothetical protein